MLGKPIIMARNTGFDEIIEENHIGCIIDYNEEGFAEGIQMLLNQRSKWPIMRMRMKELYYNQYSWELMEKRIVRLYDEINCEEKTEVHEKG